MNYYNDNDKGACAWLERLEARGLIAPGRIDNRSIIEVTPNEVKDYVHVHFFAGVGGWDLALQLAGWPEDLPVWTGSCPCQPFSCAGKGRGEKDERHLWPEFRRLIDECRPTTIFGEQVASKAGRLWLSGVRVDLEGMGYAVGAADLCSAGVGAPNIRQRLYWVAYSNSKRSAREQIHLQSREPRQCLPEVARGRGNGRVGNSGSQRYQEFCKEPFRNAETSSFGFWSSYQLIHCRDGKIRRIPLESEIQCMATGLPPGMGRLFPLAPRVSGHVAALRGVGNAINPQIAAEFIKAFMEVAL